MFRRRPAAIVLCFVSLLGTTRVAHAAPPAIDACVRTSDFNNDDIDDLAVGIPGERIGSDESAGAVQVLYGKTDGIATSDQFWHQGYDAVRGAAETGDTFGGAVAAGDFDADGISDLAIGAPGEDLGAGVVHVFYGATTGLNAADDDYITQDSGAVPGAAEAGDGFGAALASGDFDGDGDDDLAIGAPGESSGDAFGAGGVTIVEGSSTGLSTGSGSVASFSQGDAMGGSPQDGDAFGQALATCDFNGDDFVDLAIGTSESLTGDSEGMVHVLYGSDPGLNGGPGDQTLTQGSPETGDRFGASLTGGDFDGDGRADLAVGAPGENGSAGAVTVFPGGNAGLGAGVAWTQDTAGVEGGMAARDAFGFAVAAGDLNGDGRDDLAIGAPGDWNSKGAVNVLLGTNTGLSAANDLLLTQDTAGFATAAEYVDFWGSALRAHRLNGNGFDDLAIGAAEENVGGGVDAGGVQVMYGRSDLTTASAPFFSQDSTAIEDASETDDLFGFALG